MKKSIITFIIQLFLVCNIFATADIPIAKGHVHDFADKLSQPQVDTLNALLSIYYKRTTAKIAVVIEADSDEEPFDRSLKYARTWKVGTKDSNNGIVFYINVKKRKVFIQVANKLQGELTDGRTGEIIRNYWIPNAKQDKYYIGIHATVLALMNVVEGKEPPPVELNNTVVNQNNDTGVQIPFFIYVILAIVIAIQIYSLRFDIRGAKKLKMIEKGEMVL